MPLERYQAGRGFLHQLDARIKLVMTLALILAILATPERAWPTYPLLWALVGSLAAASGLSPWRLARMAGLMLPFTLAAVGLLFTLPGHTLLRLGDLAVSDAGLFRFLSILLKSWLSVQFALLLSITTPLTDLLWAFGSLRVPPTLTAIVGFTLRYSATLSDEAGRLMRAHSARSANLPGRRSGGSLLWRARSAGGMVGSLFLRSYERSERVYAAMLSRGYDGHPRVLNAPPLRRSALIYGAIPLAVAGLIEMLALLWWTN